MEGRLPPKWPRSSEIGPACPSSFPNDIDDIEQILADLEEAYGNEPTLERGESEEQVDISQLAAGIYLVRVRSGSSILDIQKLVVR